MAITPYMEWDVRTTGSDSNGGGFDPVSGTPGTDYSQQDSPQITYTDLVIDGTTNTKCTSAGNPFTSAHVGNVINITSGTGFTVQRVQVLSVTAGAATVDKSLGTLGSTGGNGKLGGALLTPTTIAGIIPASTGKIWLKAGTYTRTSTLSFSGLPNANVCVEGYSSTHGDRGTKPLITTATNSVKLIELGGGSLKFSNVSFSHTAGTRGVGVTFTGGPSVGIFEDCVFDGFSVALNADNSGDGYGPIFLMGCELKNCTTQVARAVRSIWAYDCYFHDNTGDGIGGYNGPSFLTAVRCIFDTNTNGITSDGTNNNYSNVQAINCTFYNNSNSGIKTSASAGMVMQIMAENCIFWGNGAYGIEHTATLSTTNQDQNNYVRNCAFGSNGTAATKSITTGLTPITLTSDPFTDAPNGDFTLNSTAGGGAACKAAGFQWS